MFSLFFRIVYPGPLPLTPDPSPLHAPLITSYSPLSCTLLSCRPRRWPPLLFVRKFEICKINNTFLDKSSLLQNPSVQNSCLSNFPNCSCKLAYVQGCLSGCFFSFIISSNRSFSKLLSATSNPYSYPATTATAEAIGNQSILYID